MTAPAWPPPPVPAVDTGRRHSWDHLKYWRWGPTVGKPLPSPPQPRTGPREPGDDDDAGEDE